MTMAKSYLFSLLLFAQLFQSPIARRFRFGGGSFSTFDFGRDALYQPFGSSNTNGDGFHIETDENLHSQEMDKKFNDPGWKNIWYLRKGGVGSAMNIFEAWSEGLSGDGIVVTIVDDGLEWSHPDLRDNYDPEASVDLNGNDDDPFPSYNATKSNQKGTGAAGIVAAKANNSVCGVGIAFNAKIGGIRLLDGNITDEMEAAALSFNNNYIDIYSMSWGPRNDGKTVDGPGQLAAAALKKGAEEGRNGKGSIFVWATGSGGKFSDNCNCDGYITSIYTLSVGSVTKSGHFPRYGEACSSTLVVTYGPGSELYENDITTTDLHGKCTTKFQSISSSSPIASGIVALALEANSNLTWRDIQHLVIHSATPRGVLEVKAWDTNGAGHQFSDYFGFGLMNAEKLVKMANTWKTVPPQTNCTTIEHIALQSTIAPNYQNINTYSINASSCGHIKYIEHLKLIIDLSSESPRGNLCVRVRSAHGTWSTLLAERPKDSTRTGFSAFSEWPMMSVHFWGEAVAAKYATWMLAIQNTGDKPAVLNSWKLRFYGTTEHPQPE